MVAPDGTYGGGLYGGELYGGGLPPLPTRHVRIAFDRDGYDLGGIATGAASTCEDVSAWTAYANCEIDLNVSSGWCYAGTGSIKVTATGAGDAAEVAAFGLGDPSVIVPGRTYLLWVHVRPATAQRTVRVEALWKSATDIFLTAHYALRMEAATDWTRIGVLATAPPAAGRLDVGIDFLGAAAGEVHYVDTVTVEDAGQDVSGYVLGKVRYKLSGRNSRTGQTEAGDATFTLENPHGWFTPSRDATDVAPYAGNIVPRRRAWVLAEYGGVLHPVWSGYTQRWTQTIPASLDGAGEVTVDCVDGFRWLTAASILPPYRAEVLAARPLSYYPLDEPSESSYAGDLIAGYPAALVPSSSGDGGSGFGAGSALPTLLGGATTDAGSSSLGLHQDDDVLSTSQGAILDLRYAGGMPPQLGLAPWSLEMWIVPPEAPPSGTAQVIYHQIVPDGAGIDYLSGFMLTLELSGQVKLVTGGADVVGSTPGNVCDGRGHLITVTYEPGGDWGTATLYHNSIEAGQLELTANPMPVGFPQVAQLGGAMNTMTSAISFRFTGRVAHLAHYYRRLPEAEIADRYAAGALGYYLETEADRIRAVLRLVGWPDEDTRIDRGLTPLLPRGWSESNPLALVQDTVASAGGVVVMDPLGRLRYPNRHRWVNFVPIVADFRVDLNTEVEADDFQPWLDDDSIVNEITVKRISGATIGVRDADSVRRFGLSKGPTLETGAATDEESLIHAQWLLSEQAQPRTRVDTIRIRPDTAGSALWPVLLPLEFGHRITVGQAPITAPSVEIDALVGQIAGEFGDAEWVMNLRLEYAAIQPMLVADDPVFSVLGTPTAVAGY